MKVGDCKACNELKETSLETARKGIGEEQCKSLQNDTGLNPKLPVLHNDCEDLNDLNDCFIDSFSEEVETYDDCDWKEYERDQNSNIHTVIKAVICTICGLWTNIHKLWEEIENIIKIINQIQTSITINGKIEVPREVKINKGLVVPVDLGNVTTDTRVAITWRLGSTRSTESYTVGDLRGNNAHIFGGNLTDNNHDGAFFEAFTKIKDGNKLWITTIHNLVINDRVAGQKEIRWSAQSWDSNGNVYYETQNPDYVNEKNGQYHVSIERVIVYDLVDPVKVEQKKEGK